MVLDVIQDCIQVGHACTSSICNTYHTEMVCMIEILDIVSADFPNRCVLLLQYYGPYGDIQVSNYSVPKPNVNVDIVPGCNILRNQFAVANYSGPLPCTLPGQAAQAPSSAAGGRRLMQAAYQNTNTSAPCEVGHHYP